MEFWQKLFSGYDFMPRVRCGLWDGPLIALHVVSDIVIWLSYLWIPLMMLLAYRAHRRQLRIPLPFKWICLLYVLFITACGWTHFFDFLMFYNPVYRINGLIRALTALFSLATAISLVRLIPRAITAPVTIFTQQRMLEQQYRWLRDILDAATNGVLHLLSSRDELPPALSTGLHERLSINEAGDLRLSRHALFTLLEKTGSPPSRRLELVSALHEAAMNALVHAGGASVDLYATSHQAQIWIQDQGQGIPLDRLPISTLKQGFSTAGTAGQGWFLVLTYVDRAYLLTGPGGTTLVLEMDQLPPASASEIPFNAAVGGDVSLHSR